MDLLLLRKKISSYPTPSGKITKLPDELAYEILLAWEQWPGRSSEFYKELGADHRKMACILGRAKKLKRTGFFAESAFQEVKLQPSLSQNSPSSTGIRFPWAKGHWIQFPSVDLLVGFLIKMGLGPCPPQSHPLRDGSLEEAA